MALDATKTAHEIITSGRSTGQTVIDSDGNLKWAMENIYSGEGATQAVTVVSGVAYTIRASSGSVAYSGAATGTLDASAGVARVEVTASATTLTITPTAATEIAVYRSDLAGMQFDKYGSDYLPNTTGAALYSLGVNYESGVGGMQVWEGRTNLLTEFDIWNGGTFVSGDATIEKLSESVLGVFQGVKVISSGNLVGRYEPLNASRPAVTSGETYSFAVVWDEGDSGTLYFRPSLLGATTSVGLLSADGTFSNVSSFAGPIALLKHVQLSSGLYLSAFSFVPNESNDLLLAYGPYSETSGEFIKVYAHGMEQAASSGPLIPTYGTTQTRSADDLTTLLSSFGYNVNEGTVVVDFITAGSDGADNPRAWQLSTSVDNTTRLGLLADTSNSLTGYVVEDSVSQASLEMSSLTPNTQVKVAMSFKTDDFAASQDGGAVVTDTSGNMPSTFTQMVYGTAAGANRINGEIRKLAYYPKRLSDTTLVEASS